MEFNEYLSGKKIDSEAFKKNEPEIFKTYESEFMQMHPSSFTAQKLFLINKIRRRYLKVEKAEQEVTKKSIAAKPKIMAKPRPKKI